MKVTIGVAGISFGNFWGFTEDQYLQRTGAVTELCRRLGTEVIACPQTFHDSEQAVYEARRLNECADFALLDVATFPEGKAALTFLETLTIPFGLWSRPETVHQSLIGHNSFCGANFLAGNLGRKRRRFRHFFGTCDSKEFQCRLTVAARLIGAAKQLQGSRIGLLGEGIVPKFYDIDVQPADRQTLQDRWKIEFVPIPIKELIEKARSFTAQELRALVPQFTGRFTEIHIPEQAIVSLVGLQAAIRSMVEQQGLAAVAVRCWPELPDQYGVWPCPVLSTLNDAGIPSACEGDSGGALDMLLASKLSTKPSTLLDIVDWNTDQQGLAIWHCGPTACSWADASGAKLIGHNVDGRSPDGTPAFGKPGVTDMQFASGEVTVFRTLGAIDDEFVIQGQLTTNPHQRINGSFGWVTQTDAYSCPVSVDGIRNMIMQRGLPHHFTAIRNHIYS